MTVLKESLGNRIKWYLENYPRLRDDWVYLLAILWREEIGPQNHSVSCFEFLGRLANKQLIQPESVRRSWQKILEENPDLRGPNYGTRHHYSEPEFRRELKKFTEIIKPQEKMDL